MLRRSSLLIMCLLALSGCDKINKAMNGGVDPKVQDAEAVGYACRVSQKSPQDCMKENDGQSPASVLDGWKKAEKDIKEQVIDPSMSNTLPHKAEPAPVEGATEKPAEEGKSDANAKPDEQPKPNEAKSDAKPAADKRSSH
jgi:hypothetical protein